MFNYIKSQIDWDRDLSDRAKMIDLFSRVYEGEIYNHLKYFFFQERDFSGNYIPVHRRQPSVKANFCKLVVDTSVSLLFGTDHFPAVVHNDDSVREQIEKAIKYYKLQELMILAATIGSVGSVCVFVRAFEGVLNFEARSTKYLTPVFDKKYPRKLEKLTEKYKVKGKILLQMGYSAAQISKPNNFYWFEREWDNVSEIYYLPYLCNDKDATKSVDTNRSTLKHGLGFVPAIWSKNLPNVKSDSVDGACTFPVSVIDSQIEFEYQMSQLGRALKYAGDPLLVLKLQDDMGVMEKNATPGENGNQQVVRSAANALVLTPEDEAQLLEISGDGSKAVLEYTRTLREYIMECLNGNRSNADKINAAQSGKAMQAMNQALIWLADKLRISYGDGLFIDLLNMITEISNLPGKGIDIGEGYLQGLDKNEKITLRWPDWYPDTPSDNVQTANSLKTLTDTGIMSTETATKVISPLYQIVDINKERTLIEAEQAKIAELAPKVSEVKNI
jgi:hypothetical protein